MGRQIEPPSYEVETWLIVLAVFLMGLVGVLAALFP